VQTSIDFWLFSFIVSKKIEDIQQSGRRGLAPTVAWGYNPYVRQGARDGAALDPSSEKLVSPLISHSPFLN
jgi:hypothetical protein